MYQEYPKTFTFQFVFEAETSVDTFFFLRYSRLYQTFLSKAFIAHEIKLLVNSEVKY